MRRRPVVLTAAFLAAAAAVRPSPAAAQEPVTICSGQPIPDGFGITAVGRSSDCPSNGFGTNTLTLVNLAEVGTRPVTLCSQWPAPQGFVMVAELRSSDCPSNGFGTNARTLRRLPGTGPAAARTGKGSEWALVPPLDEYEQGVYRALRRREAELRPGIPSHQPVLGRLHDDEQVSYQVELRPSVAYRVLVTCDEDCGEMALRMSRSGSVIGVAREGAPHLEIPAGAGGVHRLEVAMTECAEGPCRFGIFVYQQGEGRPPR